MFSAYKKPATSRSEAKREYAARHHHVPGRIANVVLALFALPLWRFISRLFSCFVFWGSRPEASPGTSFRHLPDGRCLPRGPRAARHDTTTTTTESCLFCNCCCCCSRSGFSSSSLFPGVSQFGFTTLPLCTCPCASLYPTCARTCTWRSVYPSLFRSLYTRVHLLSFSSPSSRSPS